MNTLVVFFLASATPALSALTASLAILQYDPLLFELKFSSPVHKPQFQLLLNNIHNLPVSYYSNESLSDSFVFSASTDHISSNSDLEVYNLIFNNPLSVGGGKLEIKNYRLAAEKPSIEVNFPAVLGILILVGAYFFNIFTEIGKVLIQFIHVYILLMYLNRMQTTLYRQLYLGMLMIPPSDVLRQETYNINSYVLLCMVLPLSILLLLGLVGFLFKKCFPTQRSLTANIVYSEFVFSTFIKFTNVFAFNLLFNSIQLASIFNSGTVPQLEEIRGIGIVLIYFNLVTFFGIIYLKIITLNPKVGQSEQSWQKYLKSEQFMDFRQLHERMHLSLWYKRNFFVILSIKNGIIAVLFFWTELFQYLMLLVEFLHIFMIFTFRPFKEEFYLNTKVVCRLIFLSEYILIVLGNLYFNMSQITFNYGTAFGYIIARDVFFLILISGIFIAIFFQIYFKCSNLSYNIKLVKEANQYKLELISKNKIEQEFSEKRQKTISNYSDHRSKASSKVPQSVSDASIKKKHQRNSDLRKQLLSSGDNKINKEKFEIEMVDINPTRSQEKHQSLKQSQEKEKLQHKRWKKQSLLEQFVEKN